jgi:hypothetical protein
MPALAKDDGEDSLVTKRWLSLGIDAGLSD